MTTLLFKNMVFEKGRTNVTIRKGTKWDGERGEVTIREANGIRLLKGEIIDTHVMRLCDIPMIILSLGHDPTCRDLAGLFAGMNEVYPCIYWEEIVTAVLFNIKED